jgi:hypothetical protein
MSEYDTVWFVKFYTGAEPDAIKGLLDTGRLSNVEVWVRIDLAPVNYFLENLNGSNPVTVSPQAAYFGIGEIIVNQVEFAGVNTQQTQIQPGGIGSAVGIYPNLFGDTVAQGPSSFTGYYYSGVELNPNIFTPSVWCKFTLASIGMDWDVLNGLTNEEVMLGLSVHEFVVGSWLVQDIHNSTNTLPPPTKTGSLGQDLLNLYNWVNGGLASLSKFMSSPVGFLIVFGLVLVLVFGAIFIVAPEFLVGQVRKGVKAASKKRAVDCQGRLCLRIRGTSTFGRV